MSVVVMAGQRSSVGPPRIVCCQITTTAIWRYGDVPDLVFVEDFEDDLDDDTNGFWTNTSSLSPSSVAEYMGNYGLPVSVSTTDQTLEHSFTANEGELSLRFYVNVDDLTMGTGDSMEVLALSDQTAGAVGMGIKSRSGMKSSDCSSLIGAR